MRYFTLGLGAASACLLMACGGGDAATEPTLPRLSAAQPAPLANCLDLASRFSFAKTRILST